MRALRALGSGRVAIAEIDEPRPADGEALVRIEASALCGSERGMLDAGSSTNAGHEAAGVIVTAPTDSGFEPGDRVGVFAVRGCGVCSACANGLETHCVVGATIALGMHAELVSAPARALRRFPQTTSSSVGALLTGDALGVPVRGLTRVPHAEGMTVVVIGLGPVGLSQVLVRSFTGADVVGVDPSPERRELARRGGARLVLGPDEPLPPAAIVIECTGLAECIALAFDTAQAGGTVLQSGECSAVTINPSRSIIHREVNYVGSWYYTTSDYPQMLRLFSEGLDIASLITHEVAAEDAADAVAAFLDARSGKVILRWDR